MRREFKDERFRHVNLFISVPGIQKKEVTEALAFRLFEFADKLADEYNVKSIRISTEDAFWRDFE